MSPKKEAKMAKKAKIIGIDLGTTNSVAAVVEGTERIVIPNPDGARITPSCVAYKNGDRLVGIQAKRQMVLNTENTIYSIKRFMGRSYDEVTEEIKLVPYKVVRGPNNDARVVLKGKEYTPPEISAMILQFIKKYASDYLGEEVKKAVITVPAYFNEAQREATKAAGRIAGLEVMRILPEPTAAALAYGLEKKKGGKIAVFDLGGGTFDISILEVAEGVFEVKSINGDTHLGGDNFDERIVQWIIEEFKKQEGIDLSKDKQALQRIREAAERAKCELSTVLETNINLPFITADASGPKHLELKLTRAKLESLVSDLVERVIEPCRNAMKDAKLEPKDIDEVILVGGMTRMPKIQEVVKEIFGKEPSKGINPDEVVAIGAAIQGAIIAGEAGMKDILLLDVTPLTLGIETLGGVMTPMIPRNTTIPTRKTQIFTTAEDNQTAVTIHVLQGERPMAKDNKSLARFDLVGIPPAPRGVPQIEVTFDIDADGILHVSAKDKATGKEQAIKIRPSSGLTEEEIQRMIDEAKKFEEEDKKKRELIETRNRADTLAYTIEKNLKDFGDKISADEKKRIEEALKNLREKMKSENKDEIEQAMRELEQAAHKLAEEMYRQASAGATGAAGTAGAQETKGEEKKETEAEYEVIEEDKDKDK